MSNNSLQIKGNLSDNPKLVQTRDGQFLATADVATHEKYVDKQTGQARTTEPEWHKVVVWGEERAKTFANSFKKGDFLRVEGPIKSSKFESKMGEKVHTYAVHAREFEMIRAKNVTEPAKSEVAKTPNPKAKGMADDLAPAI